MNLKERIQQEAYNIGNINHLTQVINLYDLFPLIDQRDTEMIQVMEELKTIDDDIDWFHKGNNDLISKCQAIVKEGE
jgi:hypothetical protein